MSDATTNQVAAVAAAPKVKYFKWTPEMEELLVRAVMAHKAFKKSKSVSETYEVKYNRVINDLWARKVFSDQGPKQVWTTMQAKLRSLCEKFRTSHGYGDDGAHVNLSALPNMDDMSETDDLLHEMCKQIATQIEENESEKRTKTQKKKTVASITDVIIKGGGKEGLAKLSEEILSSGETITSSSTDKFVKGMTAVTCEPKNRKRNISKSEGEGEDLMRSFADQFRRDDAADEARRQSFDDQIRQSGENTTAAIEAGNREAAKASMLLISAIAGLAAVLQNK